MKTLIRQRLNGDHTQPGFRDAAALPDLLYRRLLGDTFDRLPAAVRALHGSGGLRVWRGRATVTRGRSMIARVICRIIGFPPAGEGIPLTVAFVPTKQGEIWTRTFGEKSFSSFQYEGTGRNGRLLFERFGPVTVALAPVIDGDRLYLVPRDWSLLGLPLPRRWLPRGVTFETGHGAQFHFHVEIVLPLLGPVIAYEGELEPVATKGLAPQAKNVVPV